MSALKYLNANYPISSIQGSQEVFVDSYAVNGHFYIKDASDANQIIKKGPIHVVNQQTIYQETIGVKIEDTEVQPSQNCFLLILGLSLAYENQKQYNEAFDNLDDEVKDQRNILTYKLMRTSKDIKVKQLLQLTLQFTFIYQQAAQAAKILDYVEDYLTIAVSHQHIGLALNHLLLANSKPFYKILRMLVERKIPLELTVDSTQMVDQRQKRSLVAKVMFKENQNKNPKLKVTSANQFEYLQDDHWDVDLTKTETARYDLSFRSINERKEIGLVKIVTLNDYLETLLPLIMARPQLEFQVTCLILQFADLFDFNTVTAMLIEHQLDEIIFAVINMMMDQDLRQEFCSRCFINAMNDNQFSMAYRLYSKYQPTILFSSVKILPELLNVLQKDTHQMEIKLDILSIFSKYLLFRHVDLLIEIFQDLVLSSGTIEGFMVNNINPFMISVKILQINHDIKSQFPLARLRVVQYEQQLIAQVTHLLDQLYLPQIIKRHLKQKDLQGYSVLERLAELNMLEILQTKIVDRILKDIWSSKVDVSGSLMDNSSCYIILSHGQLQFNEDFESRYRFYNKNYKDQSIKPHQFTFRVWAESIKMRYFIEMVLYAILLATFQYFVSLYNRNLHKLTGEIEAVRELDRQLAEIASEALRRLQESVSSSKQEGSNDQLQNLLEEKQLLRQDQMLEVDLVVEFLDQAMDVGIIGFTLPLQVFITYVFTVLAQRKINFSATYVFDVVILMCMIIWFIKYEEYMRAVNDGLGLRDSPTQNEMFLDQVMSDINSHEFYFDYLLASTVLFFWLRLLYMFRLTETFGPTIEIIIKMMSDMAVFFALWIICIITLASVGTLLFAELPVFGTLEQAMMLCFNAAFGNYDFSIFDDLEEDRLVIGSFYLITVICLNCLILINLLIAIMSETYARFSVVDSGLLHLQIIRNMPVYKYEKQYSCLISTPPPLNVFVIPLVPYFIFASSVTMKRWVNRQVLKVQFFPFALLTLLSFGVINLFIGPLAYLKALLHKTLIVRRVQTRKSLRELLYFWLLGPFWIAMGQAFDLIHFTNHLYNWQQEEVSLNTKIDNIPRLVFKQVLVLVRERYLHQTHADAKEIILRIQERMEILMHTRQLVFGQQKDKNGFLLKTKDSLLYLKTYNLVKQILWNTVLDKDIDQRLSLKTVIALMSDIETRLNLVDQAPRQKSEVLDRVESDGEDELKFHLYKSSQEKRELARFGLIQSQKIYETLKTMQ